MLALNTRRVKKKLLRRGSSEFTMSKGGKQVREVMVENHDGDLELSEEVIEGLIAFLDGVKEVKIPKGELSIAFVDREAIKQLHVDYFDDATSTDVITITGDPEMDFAGEICVCAAVAMESCQAYGVSFDYELTLYVVHGWLHLAGYKDKEAADITEMRRMEAFLMEKIIASRTLPSYSFTPTID